MCNLKYKANKKIKQLTDTENKLVIRGEGDRGGEGSFCDLSKVYVTSFSAPVTALILGEGVLGPYLACCIEHVTNLLISASDQASLLGSALLEPVLWS